MASTHHRSRVLIADDHKLVAEGCKSLLEPEFDVVGVVASGRELVDAAEELRPDVVILDIAMPQLNGLDAGERIKQKNRAIRLIFLTMCMDHEVAAEAFRRGASGYVVKNCAADDLIYAVRHVLRGESYRSPIIIGATVNPVLRTGSIYNSEKRISSRQSEVLLLLVAGKSMKEIACELQIQPGTVAFHKYKMMEVLGIKTNAELITYAIQHHELLEYVVVRDSSICESRDTEKPICH